MISTVATTSAGTGAGPGAGARAGLVRLTVINQPDLATVQISSIQLVQGPLHVGAGTKLHDALAAPDVVGVGVHDVTSLAHVILQVLPGGPGGQILHDHLVTCPLPGRIALSSGWGASPVPSASSGVTSVLDLDPASQEPCPIQVLDSILGISYVIKLTKSVSTLLIALDDNIPNLAI